MIITEFCNKKDLKESYYIPYEGIFWYIDGKLIVLKDQVNPNDKFFCTDLLHKKSWEELKNKYTVNGKTVDYDYFPRGRVQVMSTKDNFGNLTFYADVYMDKCLNKVSIKNEIEEAFNLFMKNVVVDYPGQLFIDGSHYTCNNCN